MKTVTSFWTTQSPRPTDLPIADELPSQVDVAIVGSGYTGLNVARIVAKSGAKTAVFEQNHIGWGASSRNGGMATPGIKQKTKVMMKWYGKEKGLELWQTSLDAIDLIDTLVKEEQIECDWKRVGHVALIVKPSHLEGLRQSQAWMKQHLGHETQVLTADELPSDIGGSNYYGGMVDETSGGLDPAKYTFGLARAAARHGAALYEETAVSNIKKTAVGYEIQTNHGVVKAKEVVMATNGYTGGTVPALKPKIFPMGSYIIATEPLSAELQQKLSPKGRMFYSSKWFLNYFRLTPDGRMLWGGRNNLSPNLDLAESASILRRQMIEVFPDLADTPIAYSWGGQLGGTFDLMPHIGRADGIHYALGYGGHGLSIATYIGTEMGKLLTGEISRSPFAEIPESLHFFYRGKPWFLPLAAWWFRFLDWKA